MPLNCFSLPLMLWKKVRKVREHFFFHLGFLTKGMGPDCCVLALFTFSSQSLLVVQAWYKTLHVEIIFRLAAGSIMSAILKI